MWRHKCCCVANFLCRFLPCHFDCIYPGITLRHRVCSEHILALVLSSVPDPETSLPFHRIKSTFFCEKTPETYRLLFPVFGNLRSICCCWTSMRTVGRRCEEPLAVTSLRNIILNGNCNSSIPGAGLPFGFMLMVPWAPRGHHTPRRIRRRGKLALAQN